MSDIERYKWLLSFESLFLVAILGMFSHFLNKKIKGETLLDITHYFKNNVRSTITALIATIISFVGYYFALSTGQVADLLTSFGIGYMCDNTFNKWDKETTPKDDSKD